MATDLRLVLAFLAALSPLESCRFVFSPLAHAISASVGCVQSSEHMVIGQLPIAQLLMHHSVETVCAVMLWQPVPSPAMPGAGEASSFSVGGPPRPPFAAAVCTSDHPTAAGYGQPSAPG